LDNGQHTGLDPILQERLHSGFYRRFLDVQPKDICHDLPDPVLRLSVSPVFASRHAFHTDCRSASVKPWNGSGGVQVVTTPTLSPEANPNPPLPRGIEEVPVGVIWWGCEVGFAVINSEISFPLIASSWADTEISSLDFGHLVENPGRSRRRNQRAGAPSILNSVLELAVLRPSAIPQRSQATALGIKSIAVMQAVRITKQGLKLVDLASCPVSLIKRIKRLLSGHA
jgi:hypothetical protein